MHLCNICIVPPRRKNILQMTKLNIFLKKYLFGLVLWHVNFQKVLNELKTTNKSHFIDNILRWYVPSWPTAPSNTMVLEDMSFSIRVASMSSNIALLRSESLTASRAARSTFSACVSIVRDLPARAASTSPSAITTVGLVRARSRAVIALDLRHTAAGSSESSLPKQSSSTDHRTVPNPPTAGPTSPPPPSSRCSTGTEDARPTRAKTNAQTSDFVAIACDDMARVSSFVFGLPRSGKWVGMCTWEWCVLFTLPTATWIWWLRSGRLKYISVYRVRARVRPERRKNNSPCAMMAGNVVDDDWEERRS